MKDHLLAFKAAIAAFFTAVSSFLGWQGGLCVLWAAVMALDYLSGSLAAWMAGEWSSAAAREGLRHKAGMLFVVIVAGMTDITIAIVCGNLSVEWEWPVLVLPLVFAWYILTELGSILENAVKMGAPMPEWLMSLLSVGLKTINAQGEGLTGGKQE